MRGLILQFFMVVVLFSLVSCGSGEVINELAEEGQEQTAEAAPAYLPVYMQEMYEESNEREETLENGEIVHFSTQNPIWESPAPVVSIPPWQVGYIENFYAQPPYSYEIIVPFGRYQWISISGEFIVAEKIVQDGSPPDEFGEFHPDSISFYSALLNLNGEYIVPLGTFNSIFQVGDNFVFASNQGNSNVFDFGGSPIFPTGKYRSIARVHSNRAIVRNHEGWGVVDLDGDIIIPFGLYDSIWFTDAGEDSNRLLLTEERTDGRTQRRGIRDLEGNVIITPGQFESIGSAHGASYGMIVVGRPSGTGFTGEALFNIETGETISFSTQGLVAWDGLRIIKQGYAMTGRGIYNFYGERISPENLIFHSHPRCNERGLFTVSQGNRNGIYDLRNNEVSWLGSGLRVMQLSYPLVLVSKEDSILNHAVLDFYGQEVIPFDTYHRIERILSENRFLVRTDEDDWQSLAVVNAAGQEIVPAGEYGYLTRISGTNFLWMEHRSFSDEATGIIDFNGRIILHQYEYLFRQHWGLQIAPCTGFASDHFFMIQDSDSVALVRLTHD